MAILSKVQRGQPITADLFNNMIDAIRECQLQSVVGGTFKRTISGTTIAIQQQQASSSSISLTYPYQIYFGGSGTAGYFGIRAGTINGIIQDNTSETFSIALGDIAYVNLECTSDGKQIQSATIKKESFPPLPVATTPEVAPASFTLNLYYIDIDLKAYRTIGTSPIMAISQEMIKESITGVQFGELPYRSWYSWVFAS